MAPIPVRAEGFAYGGETFGRLPDGRICFFRGGIPGETAEVEVLFSKRTFARGVLRCVVDPSPERRAPVCPHAIRPGCGRFCPGCSFQHVDYASELYWKQRQFSDFLLRNGLAESDQIADPVPSPSRFGWRNRLKISVADGTAGFFAEDNRTIVPIEHCPLSVPAIDAALPEHLREAVDGQVFFRWTAHDGVVVNGGSRELAEQLDEFGTFTVPASSFFQTNIPVAAQLARGVAETLTAVDARILLELYCGVGFFSLVAAQALTGLRAYGVELDAAAIDCAVRNARRRGVDDRCRFSVGNAEKWRRLPVGIVPDAVLVDPPRRGLSEQLIEAIKHWKIPHVVYVSCAPDTLTRDLRRLADRYRVAGCRMYDMFPCTAHFETLVRLDLQ